MRELPDILRSGDCLVVNDTRVVPARLLGRLEAGGQAAEVLLLREATAGEWEALVRPARRCPPGAAVLLADGAARAVVTATGEAGRRWLRLEWPGAVADLLAAHGLPPLPPYIRRYRKPGGEDWTRYQTVYASQPGAVAAPTAGLHFTPALLGRARRAPGSRSTGHAARRPGDVPAGARPCEWRTTDGGGVVPAAAETAEAVGRARRRGPARRGGRDHDRPRARVRRGSARGRRGRRAVGGPDHPPRATASGSSTRS